MPGRWTSLYWAIAVVSVATCGMFVFSYTGPSWLARLFTMPIAWPLILNLALCGGFHGCGEGAWFWSTTFVIGVMMWWCFIQGARYFWRRGHGPAT